MKLRAVNCHGSEGEVCTAAEYKRQVWEEAGMDSYVRS